MKQKKQKAPFSGILLVNKPSGLTSHSVVSKLRWCLNTKEIGHAGTLDPMATGLLICMVGDATKLSRWLSSETKSYEGEIKFGSFTTTGDFEGEVIETFDKTDFSKEEIDKVFLSLEGEKDLEVPKYSAIKQNGKKLYELARENKDFTPPTRKMIFYQIKNLGLSGAGLKFFVKCSKGTYIRSFAEAVARKLNTGAHLASLNRLESGDFNLKDAVSLSFFEDFKNLSIDEVNNRVNGQSYFIPFDKVLKDKVILRLNPKEEKLILNGQIAHSLRSRIYPYARDSKNKNKDSFITPFSKDGKMLSIITVDKSGKITLENVFNQH